MPHFFVDSKAGIEMAQSAISIQLLKSATSPFTISKTMNRMFIIIHAAIPTYAAILIVLFSFFILYSFSLRSYHFCLTGRSRMKPLA